MSARKLANRCHCGTTLIVLYHCAWCLFFGFTRHNIPRQEFLVRVTPQVSCEPVACFGVVSDVANESVADTTEKPPYNPIRMTVIDGQSLGSPISQTADSADPALFGV